MMKEIISSFSPMYRGMFLVGTYISYLMQSIVSPASYTEYVKSRN